MDLIEKLARLRRDVHGLNRGAHTDDAALDALTTTLRPGLAAVEDGTGHLFTWAPAGRLRMFVLAWPARQTWHGHRADFVLVEHLPDDVEAAHEACHALDQLPPLPDFDLHLDVHLVTVRHHLLRRGMGIDSVTLMGRPAECLAGLPPAPPLPAELHITPLTTAEIDAVVALHRDFFGLHPEFCWFGANETWLEGFAKGLAKDPPGRREVVWWDDRVVGYWGSEFEAGNALWGHKAGLGIVLAPEVQHRGVVKLAYHRLLSAQVEAGVEIFRGGTSQPAVLALGKRMGRWPQSVWLRPVTKTFFDPEHFDVVLRR